MTTPAPPPPWTLTLAVPFPSERLARIAKQSLEVDREVRGSEIQRTLALRTNEPSPVLEIHFVATNPKILRTASNGFMEMLTLVVRTMAEFDQHTL